MRRARSAESGRLPLPPIHPAAQVRRFRPAFPSAPRPTSMSRRPACAARETLKPAARDAMTGRPEPLRLLGNLEGVQRRQGLIGGTIDLERAVPKRGAVD